MASLVEELITTLSEEEKLYRALIPIAEEKTECIVKNDLQSLTDITGKEQEFVNLIGRLEKKRQEVIRGIGIVLNKPVEELNFRSLISMLKGNVNEADLTKLYDELKRTVEHFKLINERNQLLIKQSLEMIEFDLNLMQSFRTAPSLGQYQGAALVDASVDRKSTFDTKQ